MDYFRLKRSHPARPFRHPARPFQGCPLDLSLSFALLWAAVTIPAMGQTLPAGAFTIAVLPDTQYYSLRYPATFTAQTDYIVKKKTERNIVYVLHEGDITDRNTDAEWTNAMNSMGLLDTAHIPYAVVPGNHDAGYNGPPGTVNFNKYFSPDRYLAKGSTPMPTFAGIKDAGKMDNNYHRFTAGGIKWLIVAVEFGPVPATADWMNALISQESDRRVIVLTHGYMYNDKKRWGADPDHTWLPAAGGLNGEQLWNAVIRKHSNIQFVISGHVIPGCGYSCPPHIQFGGQQGSSTLISRGDNGNLVYQMFVNFQENANGGGGFFRLLEFNPDANTVTAQTYSPTANQFMDTSENAFVLQNVDLSPAAAPPSRVPLAVGVFNRTQIAGKPYVFDASNSQDIGSGNILTYKWNFGDGTQVMTGSTVTHTYAVPNIPTASNPDPYYAVSMTATDSKSQSTNYQGKVKVLDSVNTLFTDDFATGMGQWSAPIVEIPNSFAQWTLSPNNDMLTNTSGGWGGDYASNGLNKPGNYVLAGDPLTLRNYSVKAKVRDDSNNGIGMVIRWQGPGDHYKISMNRNFGYFSITKFRSGVASSIANITYFFTAGQTYDMEVRVVDGTIIVLLDGVVLVSGTDTSTPILNGRFGFYDWASGATRFGNVVVSKQ